jgi:hypothetical protein
MSDFTKRLLKLSSRENFLSGWDHAVFMLETMNPGMQLEDTRLITNLRRELAELRAEHVEHV